MPKDPIDIQNKLNNMKGWMYRFELAPGVFTKLRTEWIQEVHLTRERMIFAEIEKRYKNQYPEMTCLDLGCNEGYFAFKMANQVKRVLGIDGRSEVIDRAKFVTECLDLPNIDFVTQDVMTITPGQYQPFDIVLCLGLIYHLENPMGLLRTIKSLTKSFCVIESQVLHGSPEVITDWGTKNVKHNLKSVIGIVEEKNTLLSSLTGLGFVPSITALLTMMTHAGFKNIQRLVPHDGAYEQFASSERIILIAEV